MIDAVKSMVMMGFLGGISSGIGGVLGGILKVRNDTFLAMLYEITAGMMTGIVCFDMLPESFAICDIRIGLCGVVLGVSFVYLLESFVSYTKQFPRRKHTYSTRSIVIMISMAAHNIIEGLAIGSGMVYSFSLGISILISILLHDIPEGMVVAVSNKTERISFVSLVCNCVLVGMSVGIGSFLGSLVGGISDKNVSFCLGIASGAMLYLVACDLIPSAKALTRRRVASLVYILGIILGIFITKFRI